MNKTSKLPRVNIDKLLKRAFALREKYKEFFGDEPTAWLMGPAQYYSLLDYSLSFGSYMFSYDRGQLTSFLGIPVETKMTAGLDLKVPQQSCGRLLFRAKVRK